MRRPIARILFAAALATATATASAGWTNLFIHPAYASMVSSARACTFYRDSGYGPVAGVNYQVFRRNAGIRAIAIGVHRTGSDGRSGEINRYIQDKWLYGQVAGMGDQSFASVLLDDSFVFYFLAANNSPAPAAVRMHPGQLAQC